MKKVLLWAMVLGSIMLSSCAKDEEEQPGSIYGIVTLDGGTEPLKGLRVQLGQANGAYFDQTEGEWSAESVIMISSATTYDDGHFEFTDLKPGIYGVMVDNSNNEGASGAIKVESGRQTKVDIQVIKVKGR